MHRVCAVVLNPYLYLCMCLLMTGCHPYQPHHDGLSAEIEAGELKHHVNYLAQPALGGRSQGSEGSQLAADMIAAHFKKLGLKPFAEGGQDSFFHETLFGRNVLGVLPGSDPNLAEEFVIVSAHYDHLGKNGLLSYYPGASDNAAGVAALLEVAERLAMAPQPPLRSILFAAFDSEETGLKGAYTLALHPGFHPELLAGVVNLDILGRRFADSEDDILLAVGLEKDDRLGRVVSEAGEAQDIVLLPLSRVWVGMRSDHAVFEPYGIPFVFLTMGWHPDYHRTGDTARKVDGDLLRRSALVALEAVQHLTGVDGRSAARTDETVYRSDIQAIATLLDAGLKAPQVRWAPRGLIRSLRQRLREAQAMLAQESIGGEAYRAFARDLFQDFEQVAHGPSVTPQQALSLLSLNEDYALFPGLTVGMYRQLMAQALEADASGADEPATLSYESHDVSPQSMVLQSVGDDRWRLSLAVPTVNAEGTWSKASRSVAASWSQINITADVYGQQADLIDWCLLRWASAPSDHQEIWPEVLGVMTDRWDGFDAGPGETLEPWLSRWSAKRGYADVSGWALSLLDSPNPKIAMTAVGAAPELAGEAGVARVVAVLKDPSTRPALRRRAIWALKTKHGQAAMLALVDMLSSTEVVDVNGQRPEMDMSWPFYHRTSWYLRRQYWEAQEQEGPSTLGETARRMLVMLAGEDLGETKAWREWAQGVSVEGE